MLEIKKKNLSKKKNWKCDAVCLQETKLAEIDL